MSSYKATVGTISHGTLRTEDLLITLSDELARLNPIHPMVKECEAIQTLWTAGWTEIYEAPEALETLDALFDAMDEYAPPYCTFGTSDGDGSDFGYWPNMEVIEELPKISDPNEVEAHLGEDCCFVNDHGNVTVYGANGSILLELV